MTTHTFPSAAGPVAVATHAVYTRVAWADAWTLQSDLSCQHVTRATGETLSAAEFRYRFGSVYPAGSNTLTAKAVAVINPLSYVRVAAVGTAGRTGFEWWGVWRGAELGNLDQVFSAVGIEQALDQPCRESPWWDGSAVQTVGCGLSFNAGGTFNRSAAKHTVNGQSVYVFDPDVATAEYWSTRDIVETLLAMAAVKDVSGNVLWNWTPANLAALPDFDRPEIETDGVHFLQLLRSLVTRYRLTGWTVEPSGTDVSLRFYSFAETAIDLEDTQGNVLGTIPANTQQDVLSFGADQSASATLSTESAHVADQVIVTGARRKQVFTLQKEDGAWTSLWTAALAQEYDEGASLAPDYPSDPDLQDQRDRDARNCERLRCVYSHFGPESGWDQTISDATADPPEVYYLGTADEDGGSASGDTQLVLPDFLLEIAERLPLLTGYRYDGSRITDLAGEPGHRGEEIAGVGQHEELPILAWVRVVSAAVDEDGVDRWQQLDQVAKARDLETLPDRAQRRWSGECRRLRDRLGVEIRVQGEQQHVIAKAENAGTSLAIDGAVDWGYTDQEILVTVCVEDPRPVEVRWPADEDVAAVGELLRRIRLDAPQYQLVHVIPGTVVDVDPETSELRRTDGGYVQDDRDEMLLLAQRTYQWHKTPRYALRFVTGWVDGAVKIGSLITSVVAPAGTLPVLSVVTEITVEFPLATGGTPPKPTMSLATAFAEMDARAWRT